MKETELLKTFGDRGIFDGSELIVRKEYCSEFLQATKQFGFAVIGIEGFYFFENQCVKPNIDEIADFSDIQTCCDFSEYIDICFVSANNFIVQMDKNGKSDGYCFILMKESGKSHEHSHF